MCKSIGLAMQICVNLMLNVYELRACTRNGLECDISIYSGWESGLSSHRCAHTSFVCRTINISLLSFSLSLFYSEINLLFPLFYAQFLFHALIINYCKIDSISISYDFGRSKKEFPPQFCRYFFNPDSHFK